MKNSFLHDKEDNKKTILKSFIILIPFILYGIYKNGILLYQRHYISFIEIFKPLYLVLLAIGIDFLIRFLFDKKKSIEFSSLYVAIVAMFVMPRVNLMVFTIMLSAGLLTIRFLGKDLTFNRMSFLHLLIILGMFILGKYGYANQAELENIYSLNLLDYIAGRNIGGISSTSILLDLLAFAYLASFVIYKKRIPLIAYISYSLCCLLFLFIFKSDYHIFFSSIVILSFIFIATESKSTPYTPTGEIIYAIILGIVTAFLSLLLPYEGVFISILIMSFFTYFFDKIGRKFL